jgi:hypothetical protein
MKFNFVAWVVFAASILLVFAPALAGDDESDNSKDDQQVDALKTRIEALEKDLEALKENSEYAKIHLENMDWDSDRDYLLLSNGWSVSMHGEFRTRALCEANTLNGYLNKAGEQIYAYDPKTTFSNDYGWWDSRVLLSMIFNLGDTVDIVAMLQLGDWAWGSQAPAFGGSGNEKFDHASLWIRELWARYSLAPIPLFMDFGRMPYVVGNRIIQGSEADGARLYYRHPYFEVGFGGYRYYEGENYEMEMKYNDDEDNFQAWLDIKPTKAHTLSLFSWFTLYEIPQYPSFVIDTSPLWLLPEYTHAKYHEQTNDHWNLGFNYVGDLTENFTVNLEYDHQGGEIHASDDVFDDVEAINFKGFAGFAKFDYRFFGTETIALTAGYGSGDDPETVDYEGYFAPHNDFGMRDETMFEPIKRGYFNVYEYLSPGAGVPGRLEDNLGSGGIENTTFVNLAWDSSFQANHHYYTSVGYIKASRKNPETDSDVIGIENDLRMDYLFSNNITFSLYGGHLFILGDYFRKDAHDAASLRGEWKLTW